ncbi:MAG: glycosyltransferase family 4 protein, partial [Planctomycetes bacterium]|nr:glycosyltransferase family 4 protein [Planctomycetota bacterium]
KLDRWTNGLVDHNVCVSRGVAEFAITETGLRPNKVSVIPNGVDFQRFSQAVPANLTQWGIPEGSPVLTTIGRLEHQKGIDILLQAIEIVHEQKPDCHFLIVGDGPDRQKLESQAGRTKASSIVHFVGPQNDIPGILAASTGFVLPSRWEGMSNALLEAMAAGIPVIATEVEGSVDLIESGTSGILVPSENPRALSGAILELLAHPDHGNDLSLESQVFASKHFTVNSISESYSALYKSLLCLA